MIFKKYVDSIFIMSLLMFCTESIQGQNLSFNTIKTELIKNNLLTEKGSEVFQSIMVDTFQIKKSNVLAALCEIYGNEFSTRKQSLIITNINWDSLGVDEKIRLLSEVEPDVKIDKELIDDLAFERSMLLSVLPESTIEDTNLIPSSQSVFGSNGLSISQKLMEIGVISSYMMRSVISMTEGKLVPEYMLLFLYERKIIELEGLPRKRQEVITAKENWIEANIIDESVEIREEELTEMFDLIKYAKYGVELKLANLSTDASIAYTRIYELLSELSGIDMELIEFNFVVEDFTTLNSQTISASVAMRSGRVVYRDTFYYNIAGRKTSVEEAKKTKFSKGLIDIVNQILQDKNDCKRLYYCNAGRISYSDDKIGLMLLEKNEYYSVENSTRNNYFIMGLHPESILNECVRNQLLEEALMLNLISDTSMMYTNRENIILDIVATNKLLMKPLYKIEGISNEKIFELFEEKSEGKFFFNDLKKEFLSADTVKYSFRMNNVEYQIELSRKRNYDYSLFNFIGEISNFGIDEPQFYRVGNFELDLGLLWLNKYQRDWLKRNASNLFFTSFQKHK